MLYLDGGKAFSTAPCDIFVSKLKKYNLDEISRWVHH